MVMDIHFSLVIKLIQKVEKYKFQLKIMAEQLH